MGDGGLERIVAGFGRRRVVVLSDRYPPDDAGGAERSLHLLMREPVLRDQAMVVTFDKSLACPERRGVDGVDVLALPANAAWPLHRLSQAEVDRHKQKRFGGKWPKFLAEALSLGVRAPALHAPAIAAQLLRPPPGGVRMAHATIPEGRSQADIRIILDGVRPKLVHADNARSIMMAADVLTDRNEAMVALVRDHRFTSFRFDQGLAPLDPAGLGLGARFSASCARAALAYRQACLKRPAAVIATSRFLAGTLDGVAPGGRLRRLPLEPVELPSYAQGAQRSDFTVLLVGSLSQNKGQAHLLRGWPELVARMPNVRFDLAGRGPTRADIERVAKRHGVEDRIRLHGYVTGDALARLYQEADVVALPTMWAEPFGRVPIEAGAAGRPVVAYASGGLVETVVDGVTGRVVPRGDRAAFVDALADLAADPVARIRMGEAGRARVVETYSPRRLAGLLAAVWDEAIAEAGLDG